MTCFDGDRSQTGDEGEGGLHPVRSGATPWRPPAAELATLRLAGGTACDVLIVGGGITGAMTAEALTRQGLSVLVVDRAFPGHGSTAASTAMLLWEIDTTLVELADTYGFDKAVSVYRRSLAAVRELGALVSGLGLDCGYAPRPSLYLADVGASPDSLSAEHAARQRAGLPGEALDRGGLMARFGIDRPAALVAEGSAEADPVRLAHGLLRRAFERGARFVADEVVRYDPLPHGGAVALASGATIEAGTIVLATGYDMPDFVPSRLHRIVSTWCIATPPQAAGRLWRDRALIWEAADPYLYARFDAENRLLVGGEDEEIVDATEREQQMPAKAARLVDRMRGLQPQFSFEIEAAWTAAFGETADGLPLIGPVPGAPNLLAAYGYGGNGITFSFLASRMIAAWVAGEPRAWFEHFAIDR
jgi:glycine/D-amino acid oxidase-like deaminating enzyme